MVNSVMAADIIIIDDMAENLKVLRDLLRERGHRIRTANSGELGLASIKAKIPDLVLLDIRMPGIDGYEVCRRMKADPNTEEIPIIFLTGLNDQEDKVKGFKLGGSDFITKPFQIEEVLARVDNFLRIFFLQQDLKAKATRIENILAGTNAGTWEWNAQTGEQDSNERWAEIIGYTLAELSPFSFDTFMKLAHPEDMEKAQAEMNRAFNKEIPLYDIEFRMRHKDGRWVWINSRGIVTSWTPEGKPLIVSGVHLDITERKLVEQELYMSEQRFRVTQEISPDGFTILHPVRNETGEIIDFIFVYENQTIARINHTDPQKVIGKRLLDLFPDHRGASILEAYIDVANTGNSQIVEDVNAGEVLSRQVWLRLVIVSISEDIAILAQDITERKKAEDQIRQSEEKFQMLFNQAPLGYQSLNIEGCFIDVNQKWLDMLGYSREEVIGQWFGDFLSPAYRDGFRKRFPIFKAQGYIYSEFEMVAKSGKKLFMAFDGKIGFDIEGAFKQTHCILKDISVEKQLQNQLMESEKSLLESQRIAHLGSWRLDLETNEVFWTEELYKMYGFDPTIPPPPYTEHMKLFTPESWDKLSTSIDRTRNEGIPYEIELQTVTKSGDNGWMWARGEATKNADGEIIGLWGAAQDITERKALELSLSNEKKLLQATLISVGDGVISCDKNGKIMFINHIAEDLTGWGQEEATGRSIEEVFHIINEVTGDKSENIAAKVLESGVINELANHTILISADGSRRPIEDSAAPIIQDDGQIIGVVIVFSDFSEKREKMEQIQYLSYHDYLTGLYNRRYFEEELKRYDTARNIPMTIVMGDVNGLKLINDSFGHDVGDELLKKAAEIIMKGCRADDIVARLGGDEFVIALPKTDALETDRLLKRIQSSLSEHRVGAIALSVSFGFETKLSQEDSLQDVLKNAEDHMYRHKLYESASMRSKTINLIMNTLYEKNNREMNHSQRVGDLCESIARCMDLSTDDINQIRTAGLMHDIGKIGIEDHILNKTTALDEHEWEEIQKHSEVGYRILSSVNEFSEVADYVLEHQERWDGTGYPRGLKAEEISLQARIIAIADAFDAMTGERTYGRMLNKKEAIEEIRRCSGSQFDPKIAKLFVDMYIAKA